MVRRELSARRVMAERDHRRPSEWRRLFHIAGDLIDKLRENTGGHDFQWLFGGATAMMIPIGHIFLDDAHLLGFLDPSRSGLRFDLMPSDYQSDGLRFQKFAFENIAKSILLLPGS